MASLHSDARKRWTAMDVDAGSRRTEDATDKLTKQVEALTQRLQRMEKRIEGLERRWTAEKIPRDVAGDEPSKWATPVPKRSSPGARWPNIKIESGDDRKKPSSAVPAANDIDADVSAVKNVAQKFEQLTRSGSPSASKNGTVRTTNGVSSPVRKVPQKNGAAPRREVFGEISANAAPLPATKKAATTRAEVAAEDADSKRAIAASEDSEGSSEPESGVQKRKNPPATATYRSRHDVLMGQLKDFTDKGVPLKKVSDRRPSDTGGYNTTKIVIG